MQIDENSNAVVLTDIQGDFTLFLMKLTHQYKTFEKQNIIIDLLIHKELTVIEVKSFLSLSKQHKMAKKSFVIVVPQTDFNAISDKLTVVPTLQEAHDIIEMEEIERDLGF
jgi:2-polyprenyl-3-methyl-5-hydroxy-6-metoxy-1,4-benzoquinol methylase